MGRVLGWARLMALWIVAGCRLLSMPLAPNGKDRLMAVFFFLTPLFLEGLKKQTLRINELSFCDGWS
jgi:hypothetical protein